MTAMEKALSVLASFAMCHEQALLMIKMLIDNKKPLDLVSQIT